MDEVSAMLVRLNLETRSLHAAADAGWRALMVADVNKQQYIDQLVRVYGFEGPLEAALAYTPHLDLVIDVHERYRAGFIAQDLMALGMRPAEVARLPQCVLAPFASPLEALGWIYVAERWTLLFDEVRRNVLARVPHAKDACSYLAAGDGVINMRWQRLGHHLDRAVRSERMTDEVIEAAQAGFRMWIDWDRRRTQPATSHASR